MMATVEYGFQSEEAKKFPSMVILDITNVCNLECSHCPHKSIKKLPGYKPTFMQWNTYKKIIKELSENNILLFRFASDGESLLHPRFIEMVRYAKKNKIFPINLTTNGLLLDEKMTAALLKTQIDVIDVSLDAYTKEKYEIVRKKSDYHKVMANVHNLLYLRNKISPETKVMVSMIDQSETKDEIELFKNYWDPLVDRVLIRSFCNALGLVGDAESSLKIKRWPCPQLWKRITISCKGEMRFCVEDWLSKTVVGDIHNQSIKDVWQGKVYNELREAHLKDEYSKITICANCTDWAAARWDYGYEYAINKIFHKGAIR